MFVTNYLDITVDYRYVWGDRKLDTGGHPNHYQKFIQQPSFRIGQLGQAWCPLEKGLHDILRTKSSAASEVGPYEV